ncbi:hypothetical protein EDD85DRAFT_955745 [Armillaria nabsnona]|nr:hypothetical protein EDD85DRAFT_955745 [Armillaria nabsnona]
MSKAWQKAQAQPDPSPTMRQALAGSGLGLTLCKGLTLQSPAQARKIRPDPTRTSLPRREYTTLHSFNSFDMSIGGLNIELRDTENNRNADSSLQPEYSQKSDDQEKVIGLNDCFSNAGSAADMLGAKLT